MIERKKEMLVTIVGEVAVPAWFIHQHHSPPPLVSLVSLSRALITGGWRGTCCRVQSGVVWIHEAVLSSLKSEHWSVCFLYLILT